MSEAFDESLTDLERNQRILEQRARALAQPLTHQDETPAVLYLMFRLAFETFGIESRFVREVVPLKALTPLPCVPAFVAGLMNVRGQVLSVIDLRQYLGLPEGGLSDLNKVIVLSHDEMEFGVLADAVLETDAARELQPPLAAPSGLRQEYFLGITRDGVLLLDGQKLLCDGRIVVNQGME
ncbi:purine-binding chemotaxis protein CheW [Novimethylophilus kurashikiensis]|uniref:Purine-binding chemotaxis protein CheW n=1 Tax=Novimethylophilus kurashikiensis TaxID=1825523 RepID=A0A2R5F493_9PROT|nr:chemotaxis protein CheW [Novimethylophilus kurashikiensis]GBG13055.1 purine-binding chemotaxis protein CheW [Novimethylophilus kurashikiensis]